MIALALAAAVACNSPRTVDGDTLDCSGVRVRLFGIDAPEVRHGRQEAEPFAAEATEQLRALTRGPVICTPAGNQRDRYQRTVAKCGSTAVRDVGAVMVRLGLAQDWPRYSRRAYAADEAEARAARRGMWR